MQLDDVIRQRRSVKKYDRDYTISDEQLQTLFSNVVLSPSSFNLQHWRFVVVRDPDLKKNLRAAAWDQEQLETASAVIVVAGKLDAHEDAQLVFADAPQSVRDMMIPMTKKFYADRPQLQRDEAIRSSSLATMSLMLAACDMGFATCPMIGFDPDAVSKLVHMEKNYIPVMLVVIGKQVGELRSRAMRLGLDTVVKLETMDGAGLA